MAAQRGLPAPALLRPASVVKVRPLTENARRFVRHPNGTGFNDESGTNWPNDSFTARRLRDGDIEVVGSDVKSITPGVAPSLRRVTTSG